MRYYELFLRPLDRVLEIPFCNGKSFLIEGSKSSRYTQAQRVYLYEAKRTAPVNILFGSFLSEEESMEEVCLTQHQILKIIGKYSFLFEGKDINHFFLTKEGGGFVVIMLYEDETSTISFLSEKISLFSLIEEEFVGKKFFLYLPDLVVG